MDILSPLHQTWEGYQFIIVMMDRYLKLLEVTLSTSNTAPHVVSTFFDHWIIPYGIPTYLLTDNGLSSLPNSSRPSANSAKRWSCVCAITSPSTNVTGISMFSRLCTPKNTQIHRLASTKPFGLVRFRHAPGSKTFDQPSALPTEANVTTSLAWLRHRLLHQMTTMRQAADKRITNAQAWCKKDYSRCARPNLVTT